MSHAIFFQNYDNWALNTHALESAYTVHGDKLLLEPDEYGDRGIQVDDYNDKYVGAQLCCTLFSIGEQDVCGDSNYVHDVYCTIYGNNGLLSSMGQKPRRQLKGKN
jgi:hypothetical protein